MSEPILKCFACKNEIPVGKYYKLYKQQEQVEKLQTEIAQLEQEILFERISQHDYDPVSSAKVRKLDKEKCQKEAELQILLKKDYKDKVGDYCSPCWTKEQIGYEDQIKKGLLKVVEAERERERERAELWNM